MKKHKRAYKVLKDAIVQVWVIYTTKPKSLNISIPTSERDEEVAGVLSSDFFERAQLLAEKRMAKANA